MADVEGLTYSQGSGSQGAERTGEDGDMAIAQRLANVDLKAEEGNGGASSAVGNGAVGDSLSPSQVEQGAPAVHHTTPTFSLPGRADPEIVKKQLFTTSSAPAHDKEAELAPQEASPGAAASGSRLGSSPSLSRWSDAAPEEQDATSGDALPPAHVASGPKEGPLSSELRLIIEPSRFPSALAPEESPSVTPVAAIGLSPGARTFAPPFGARFGDRGYRPQGKPKKGMELVQEEDDHGGEAWEGGADAVTSPPEHGATPGTSAEVVGGLHSATASVLARGGSGGVAGGAHAHVASVGPSGALHADTASRSRLRVAVEPNRDASVLLPQSSKFAATPRPDKSGRPQGAAQR